MSSFQKPPQNDLFKHDRDLPLIEVKPDVPSIDLMPQLAEHLGPYRTARIRYAQKGTGKVLPRAINIENTVIEAMQFKRLSDGDGVADILSGLAASSTGGSTKPLSAQHLYAIFQCMSVINSREIELMLNISPRQARKYLQLARIALPLISVALAKGKHAYHLRNKRREKKEEAKKENV